LTSPILVNYIINSVAEEVTKRGRHGVQLAPDVTKVFPLLFADAMPAQSRPMNQTCWSSMTMTPPQFVPLTMRPPMPPASQAHPQTAPPPQPPHFTPGGILDNGNENMPFSQPFGMPPHSLYNPHFIHKVDTSVPPPGMHPRIPYPMPVQQQPPYTPSNVVPPTPSVAPTSCMLMTNGSHFGRAPLQMHANAQTDACP